MTSTERAAFLTERSQGVGGSDIASVFGVGYGCRLRLWYDKRGVVADYPDEDSGPMKLGRWLEPYVADEYSAKTGREVSEAPMRTHPDHPELLVHIDRAIRHESGRGLGVLEIKAFGRGMFAKMKREGMPEDYVLQIQHGMLVTGFRWASFAALNRDTGELIYWDHERDNATCDLIKEEAVAFWVTVQNGPAPERLDPDDPRCQRCQYRRSCQGAALMESMPTSELEAAEDLRPVLMEYDERKALYDEAEALLDETKEVMRTALGDRQAVEVMGRKIYYRPQTSMRVDTKLFNACYPDVVKRVLVLIANARDAGVDVGDLEKRLATYGDFKRASTSQPLRIY